MNRYARRLDVGWLIAGAAVLFVGGYYFLRNTLGFTVGDLNWDALWPILVIAIGISILAGVWRHARGGPVA